MAHLDVDITTRLRAFELRVALALDAETLALVGPSGSGKTTVLRCIAGLQRPGAGRIAVDGRTWFGDGTDLAPEERSVGMVFQDYALFPHLTVQRNVEFGANGTAAGPLLETLGIAHLAGERPDAISGGERQRVALARALARQPHVLLLDEPLSALDAHTRRVVRNDLAAALAAAALPTIVVTHDFREAAVLARRIAVLEAGRVLQAGTADELLAAPGSATVATLTGMTVVEGVARGATVRLASGLDLPFAAGADGPVALAVRPWLVGIHRERPGSGGVAGRVAAISSEGARTSVQVGELVAEQPAHVVAALGLQPGDDVWLDLPEGAVTPIPLTTTTPDERLD